MHIYIYIYTTIKQININKSYLTETWCESINPTKISKVGGPCFCGPIENDKNETHRRNISALNERDDDLNKSEKIYNDIQIHIWFVFNFGCFYWKDQLEIQTASSARSTHGGRAGLCNDELIAWNAIKSSAQNCQCARSHLMLFMWYWFLSN